MQRVDIAWLAAVVLDGRAMQHDGGWVPGGFIGVWTVAL